MLNEVADFHKPTPSSTDLGGVETLSGLHQQERLVAVLAAALQLQQVCLREQWKDAAAMSIVFCLAALVAESDLGRRWDGHAVMVCSSR
jgi:hypothetical protein